ncbi:hypothetical protein ENBRE01_1438 [Enteropsectra breve]|nr:hypothetical protein ENBRE01_1438 [Enteropsectra breve]
MEQLLKEKSEIENEIEEIENKISDINFLKAKGNAELSSKIKEYNRSVQLMKTLKARVREKRNDVKNLYEMVRNYKKEEENSLKTKYREEITAILAQINAIVFEFKLNIFRKFDLLSGILTEKYPNLHKKKEKLFSDRKHDLKACLFDGIKETMHDKDQINKMIFLIKFLVKYEEYFREFIFNDFLYSQVEYEFQYHFMSDRESNRLDKPEWMLDFLLQKYQEYTPIIEIYNESLCEKRMDVRDLISRTQSLLNQKISEYLKTKSLQKRKLSLNFVSKFIAFKDTVLEKYALDVELTDVGYLLAKTQKHFIKKELQAIHDKSHLQWLSEYKKLFKDSLEYVLRFGAYDYDFKIEDLTTLVVLHIKAFVDGLMFINREEVRVLCFLFSELEDLKAFLLAEQSEMMINYNLSETLELLGRSIEIIQEANASTLKLIKHLAQTDINNILCKIIYFTYTSGETKRNTVVEISKIVEDYKHCVYFAPIERLIAGLVDGFFMDNIILKIKMDADELEEFKTFQNKIQNIFSKDISWISSEGCAVSSTIIAGNKSNHPLYKTISKIYL